MRIRWIVTNCGRRFCPREVALKVAVVLDMTATRSMIEMCRNFLGNCCLQFQGRSSLLKTAVGWLDVCMFVHRCICVEKENQLDASERFIALIICSTCVQALLCPSSGARDYMCVLLPLMVCSAWLLVVGGQVQDSRLCVQDEGYSSTESGYIPLPGRIACLQCTWPPTTSNQALHTIGGSKTRIVSSSWWWT